MKSEGTAISGNVSVDPGAWSGIRERRAWSAIIVFFFLIVILRSAWITEDAYIMFRSIENLLNGYGLTWNTKERVQTFTNPLWTLILAGIRSITTELFFTSIAMGTACTLGAIWILCMRTATSRYALPLAVLPLLFSKAFIDFSTSGLENPFTFLGLALFYMLYFNSTDTHPGKYLFHLSLITSMALLNRMDTLLFFAPALTVEFLRLRGWRHIGKMLLGFLPFILWEIFSIIYYGFPFPNTAYAKLNTGVTALRSLKQGVHYMINSFAWDPVTLLTILGALILMVCARRRRGIPLLIGVLLYLFYTLRVGGDFMSGRFLAAPLFASAIGIAVYATALLGRAQILVIALLIVAVGVTNDRSPLTTNVNYHYEYHEAVDRSGIADERGFYYQDFGLLNSRVYRFPDHDWRDWGEKAGNEVAEEPVVIFSNIGVFGYYASPDLHIVDLFALGDPLLARLPAQPGSRIGHFKRSLPAGYVETLKNGRNVIIHPDLAKYYDALSTVISGPVFSWERAREIYRLNTGYYDHLLASYLQTRHVVTLPLHDLLDHDTFSQHAIGWWGANSYDRPWQQLEDTLYAAHIWGLGNENYFLLQPLEPLRGTLRFALDSPIEDQWVEVYLNDELQGHFDLTPDVMLKEELQLELTAGQENWLTFRYGRRHTPEEPLIPWANDPLTVRFHELGFHVDR